MKSRFLFAFALGAIAAIGCSPANVANPDAGPDTSNSACTSYARARCTQLQTCSTTALQLRYGDVTTCEALFRVDCVNAIAAPSSGATIASAKACGQAITDGDWKVCSDFLLNQNPPSSCGVMPGALANGAPCAFPAQCQSGFCAIVPGKGCGSCANAPKAGDSCASLVTCGPTMACAGATSTCASYAAMGGSCGPGQPCGVGLTCVGSNGKAGGNGTCVPATSTLGAA